MTAAESRAMSAVPAGGEGKFTSSTTSQTAPERAAAASPGVAAAAVPTYQRYVKTYYEDPIQIDISSTSAGLRWNKNQWLAKDTKRTSYQGGGFDPTYIVSQNNYWGAYSDRWEFSAVTHFRNETFAQYIVSLPGVGGIGWAACGFPLSPRADFYHDVQVVGRKNSTWAVNWNDDKTGACTNLVHHESENGAGWPF